MQFWELFKTCFNLKNIVFYTIFLVKEEKRKRKRQWWTVGMGSGGQSGPIAGHSQGKLRIGFGEKTNKRQKLVCLVWGAGMRMPLFNEWLPSSAKALMRCLLEIRAKKQAKKRVRGMDSKSDPVSWFFTNRKRNNKIPNLIPLSMLVFQNLQDIFV